MRTRPRWNSTGSRQCLYLRLLWPWPLTFWPTSSQQIYEAKYVCDQSFAKFPHQFLRYGVHKVLGTHTHSRTDTSENSVPPAPKVFGGGDTKCRQMSTVVSSYTPRWRQRIEVTAFQTAWSFVRLEQNNIDRSTSCKEA